MNIDGTAKYNEWLESIFKDAERSDVCSKIKNLPYGYTVECYDLLKNGEKADRGQYRQLYDSSHNIIFTYLTTDEAPLCTVVERNNGIKYFFFCRELYGFSFLNLSTLKVIDYVPEETFTGKETFIWCDVIYNPQNDMLAVDGCYWACGTDTMVLSFGSLFNYNGEERIAKDMLENGSQLDAVDFYCWENTDLLVITEDEDCNEAKIRISQEQYSK